MSAADAVRIFCFAASGAAVSLLLHGEVGVAIGVLTFIGLTMPRL